MKNIVLVGCILCEQERGPFTINSKLINIVDAYPVRHLGYVIKKGAPTPGFSNTYLCKDHYDKSEDISSLSQDEFKNPLGLTVN